MKSSSRTIDHFSLAETESIIIGYFYKPLCQKKIHYLKVSFNLLGLLRYQECYLLLLPSNAITVIRSRSTT